MEFRIADTFTDSLGRLTGEEQKAVKTTAFDLQINPAQPGLQFHRLRKPRDPNFSSIPTAKAIWGRSGEKWKPTPRRALATWTSFKESSKTISFHIGFKRMMRDD